MRPHDRPLARRRSLAGIIAPDRGARPPRRSRVPEPARVLIARRRPRREGGFTLVELLVVVVIVGVLAGTAVPSFLSQRDRAWESATRSQLRAAVVALESYRAERGAYDATALSVDWGYVGSDEVVLTQFIEPTTYCISARYGTEGTSFVIENAGANSAGAGTILEGDCG
jgi:prepilin-type N-terminal cleavage/methylation domain-containing protein